MIESNAMNTEQLKEKPKPSFKNPPLIEVVAGVQFENPLGFKTLDLADVWEGFDKKKFPKYREMPPLDPILENNVQLIDFRNIPPMRRFWFEDSDDSALIQVQEDRLIYNWKRPEKNYEEINCYPRYENVIEDFFKYFSVFQEVLKAKDVTNLNPSFLELSYINLIDLPTEGLSAIEKIFRDMRWGAGDRILPVAENVRSRRFFEIPDLPLKLVADITTRQKKRDGKVVLQYELSVRGPVKDISMETMREWFDNARLWITFGFLDTTTDSMHKKWGVE